jgi:hypothetical protein
MLSGDSIRSRQVEDGVSVALDPNFINIKAKV